MSSLTSTHLSISVIVADEKSKLALALPPPTSPVVVTVTAFVPLLAAVSADEYEHVNFAWGTRAYGKNTPQSTETGLPVYVCSNPETAVVEGTGKTLESLSLLSRYNGHKR